MLNVLHVFYCFSEALKNIVSYEQTTNDGCLSSLVPEINLFAAIVVFYMSLWSFKLDLQECINVIMAAADGYFYVPLSL